MNAVEAFFGRLGSTVESAWAAVGYDEQAFPAIASRALHDHPPVAAVDLDTIVEWAFQRGDRVPQMGSKGQMFGQPPFTVYWSSKFYVEVILWVDGSTSIHEHAFDGAFTPLLGASVHSRWRFAEAGRCSGALRTGEVSCDATEILRVGDVREIHGGRRGAHQLFHLDRPSATVVVRTHGDSVYLPQLSYLPPGLAFAELEDDDPQWARLSRYLGAFRLTSETNHRKYVRAIVLGDDIVRCLRCVRHISTAGSAAEVAFVESLAPEARARHGAIYDAIAQSQEFVRRSALILQRRSRVHDEDHRFFLAMLMLMPDRDGIHRGIREWTGSTDVESTLLSWLSALSGEALLGVDFDDANLAITRSLLRSHSLPEFFAQLELEYGPVEVDRQRSRLVAHARELASAVLLRPLFGTIEWL